MSGIIQPGMNDQQFLGALSSINDVAGRYADEDQLRTVADYRKSVATPPNPRVVPPGATPGRDTNGNIIGYRTADGQVIRF
jgi:hypothetical protein